MTPDIRNFCKGLKKIAGNFNWKVCRNGRLRGFRKTDRKQKHGFCPLTASYYVKTGQQVSVNDADQWYVRDNLINVGFMFVENANTIIASADKMEDPQFSREVRDKLLNAVGI